MFTIRKEIKTASLATTIRFEDELYYAIKEIAHNENISFNSLILQCCKYALSQYAKKK